MKQKKKDTLVVELVEVNGDFDFSELHVHLPDAKRVEFFRTKKNYRAVSTDCGTVLLPRFPLELADVTIHADMQVNVDGFLRFADYFFDGLFADWAVLERIGQSSAQVQGTRHQIERVLSQLNDMTAAARQEQARLQQQLDALVLAAPL